jgi:general stress protein YciG
MARQARKGKVDPAVRDAAKMLGELGGNARKKALSAEERQAIARKGGRARAKALSTDDREALARRAARARWDRERQNRDTGPIADSGPLAGSQ